MIRLTPIYEWNHLTADCCCTDSLLDSLPPGQDCGVFSPIRLLETFSYSLEIRARRFCFTKKDGSSRSWPSFPWPSFPTSWHIFQQRCSHSISVSELRIDKFAASRKSEGAPETSMCNTSVFLIRRKLSLGSYWLQKCKEGVVGFWTNGRVLTRIQWRRALNYSSTQGDPQITSEEMASRWLNLRRQKSSAGGEREREKTQLYRSSSTRHTYIRVKVSN